MVDEFAAVLGTLDTRSCQRQLLLEEAADDARLSQRYHANRIQAASQETRESCSQTVSAG